jgi:sugar lactone lactonase YvrE
MTCVMIAEQFSDPVAFHGEGPVWSSGWGGLRCVDMFAGDVLSIAADGSITRRHVGTVAAAVRPRAGGGAVIAVERGFALEDRAGALTTLPPVWSDPSLRMNDGGCDPHGRFYCGSIDYDQAPGAASLYRLDADLSVARIFGDVTISNGLDWSPDGECAYYVDSTTRRIDVFDYDAVTGLSGRRPLVRVAEGAGNPDGLTVDAEGCIWVAMYGGGAVHRYTSNGVLDGVVDLPVSQVTACAFGGADLDELYITTSRENLPDGVQPEAGSVYRCRPGVRGRVVAPFAG